MANSKGLVDAKGVSRSGKFGHGGHHRIEPKSAPVKMNDHMLAQAPQEAM